MKKNNSNFLLKKYDFLYYHYYKGALWTSGESNLPHQTATYILSILMYLNLFTIMLIVTALIGTKAINWTMSVDPNSVIPFAIIVMALHHYLFIYKKRYLKIIKQYKNETPRENLIGRLSIWFYLLFTIGFFLLILRIFY